MSNLDLRTGIVPTRLENSDVNGIINNKYDTVDLIYIDSQYDWNEKNKTSEKYRIATATDSAKAHNTWVGANGCAWRLRSTWGLSADYMTDYGTINIHSIGSRSIGIRPALHYNFPLNNNFEPKIIERKNEYGETLYHCLLLGKVRGSKVDEKLNKNLEDLYNGGNLDEKLTATGLWYTNNGQKEDDKNFAGAYSPIFEYEGKRYVREISYPYNENVLFSNGTAIGNQGKVVWQNEEDYSWIIRNWEDLPKSINPNGNEKASDFDLLSEEVTIGNIPFYPNENDIKGSMWQNSMLRGYLNGIDVRNINQNEAPEYGAERGGDFSGKCNFLNETFNLEREPILEFKIPESETEIPDDAFNRMYIPKKNIHTSRSNNNWKQSF